MIVTKQEIFKLVLEKAMRNGWQPEPGTTTFYSIIFSHDFAKAYFDTASHIVRCIDCKHPQAVLKAWEWHLQQMVLEEDPLEYLARFL